jgi:hypothetical protein
VTVEEESGGLSSLRPYLLFPSRCGNADTLGVVGVRGVGIVFELENFHRNIGIATKRIHTEVENKVIKLLPSTVYNKQRNGKL